MTDSHQAPKQPAPSPAERGERSLQQRPKLASYHSPSPTQVAPPQPRSRSTPFSMFAPRPGEPTR